MIVDTSICLVVKNGLPYLKEALESVASQSYKNFKLLVQDGVSTDGTLDVLNEFKNKVDFEVDIISEPDFGIADAYNKIRKRVDTDYFAYIDSDNKLLPNHLEHCVNYLKKNKDTAIVASSQFILNQTEGKIFRYSLKNFDLLGSLTMENVIPAGSLVWNKQNMKGEIFFNEDPKLGHVPDYELKLRWHSKKLKIDILNEFTYMTRLSEASGSSNYDRYFEFTQGMLNGLELFLQTEPNEEKKAYFRKLGGCGINMWAAEQIYFNAKDNPQAMGFIERAKLFIPDSPRLKKLKDIMDKK